MTYTTENLRERQKRSRWVADSIRAEEKRRADLKKPYGPPSEKALSIIKHAKQIADKKGNLKCGDRMIDAMKSVGVPIGEQVRKP